MKDYIVESKEKKKSALIIADDHSRKELTDIVHDEVNRFILF
jgi:nickel-dependent lactate racemase